jgi:hypothetical protein
MLENFQVIDLLGKTVLNSASQEVYKGSNSIDVQGLPSGIYVLRMQSADSEYLSRFFKE